MELKQAAKELRIGTRHLHRLIRVQALPAKKTIKLITIQKPVWDIDDGAIQSAKELLDDWRKSEAHFGSWVLKWVTKLNIPASKLAQMTKIKKDKLLLIMQRPGYTIDDYDGEDPTWRITGALMREYIRQKVKKAE